MWYILMQKRHIHQYLAHSANLRDPKVREFLREVSYKVELNSMDTLK